MSRWGADVLDIGCALLSMHSPCEITAKKDIYSLYLGIGVFFKDSMPAWQSMLKK